MSSGTTPYQSQQNPTELRTRTLLLFTKVMRWLTAVLHLDSRLPTLKPVYKPEETVLQRSELDRRLTRLMWSSGATPPVPQQTPHQDVRYIYCSCVTTPPRLTLSHNATSTSIKPPVKVLRCKTFTLPLAPRHKYLNKTPPIHTPRLYESDATVDGALAS